jgi:ribonuclease R
MRGARVELTGTVRGTRSGFAFLALDEGGEDVFIPSTALHGAIHGDRVRATVGSRGPHDFRPEAVVEEILERPRPEFTGNLFRLGKSWFVRPDSPLLPERMRLVLGTTPPASGIKILFSAENRGDREHTPVARYLAPLGEEEDARLDPVVIATEFGLGTRFSEEALAEAKALTAADGGAGGSGTGPTGGLGAGPTAAARAQAAEDRLREDFRGQ